MLSNRQEVSVMVPYLTYNTAFCAIKKLHDAKRGRKHLAQVIWPWHCSLPVGFWGKLTCHRCYWGRVQIFKGQACCKRKVKVQLVLTLIKCRFGVKRRCWDDDASYGVLPFGLPSVKSSLRPWNNSKNRTLLCHVTKC